MSEPFLFHRILVANRGEIAVRIIRTLRDLGIESVAVYTDRDAASDHVLMADIAVRLQGETSHETYLNPQALLNVVETYHCDGVHPGYGFLSENSEFARLITQSPATFIGPSPQAMELMGNKISAKSLMNSNDIPTVPGSFDKLDSLDDLIKITEKIGFPVMLKAAHGGGGKGMRIATKAADLPDAFEACQREAQAYFNKPEVFVEKYIPSPRHIEFQILCDQHGNGIHLMERDCSIQRRHQKLLEEAPSVFLTPEQRQKLGETAVKAALAVKYVGAGTVEFICHSADEAYFMEMNTRIQVEHCVTEMITGVDLIAEQIKIAAGKPLSLSQNDIKQQGWAIEARINAEDPANGFIPTPGTITQCHLPMGPFVRTESHIHPGYSVPPDYDSMIAKIIAWGPTRESAIAKLKTALLELRTQGIQTTALFHYHLLSTEAFATGHFNTHFLNENEDDLAKAMNHPGEPIALLAAAILGQLTMGNHVNRQKQALDSRQLWTIQSRQETQNH